MFTRALTRQPGPDLAGGLTTAALGAPDPHLALRQHARYVEALRGLGLEVQVLPPLPGHPDACFVEDTAVLAGSLAVVARPGAPSRRGETGSVAAALAGWGTAAAVTAPGTLDGGDVLAVERTCWIGLSGRTNAAGAAQLAHLLTPLGWDCRQVPVGAGLHLKSGVNHVGGRTLLLTEQFAGRDVFAGWEQLVVPAGEAYACNTLWINGTLLMPAGFPAVRALLVGLGLPLVELETSEFRKLDGGLTCLSLRS
ncbi:MAG: amidinotransferase [Krumholzibacteria bacterium]|nr:amidinotransferase [Candidatus Krumholzibacteria bacterium]